MTAYDLIVLGGGTGNAVAAAGADAGMETALVEQGPLGGTCLNRGCNPSKKLIHRADVAEAIRRAEGLGVEGTIEDIAFAEIVDGVTETVTGVAEGMARNARERENLTLYQDRGRFVDDHTVEVEGGGARLVAETIVLAGGSRPTIPASIDGTDATPFLTSDEALRLEACPDRLVVVGGGYIAVEMSHFFSQMGSDVTIVGRGETLVDREDTSVAERLTEAYREKHELYLGYEATAIAEDGGERIVTAESGRDAPVDLRGDRILLATGRRPNSDVWNVSAAGIATDDQGYVETDRYLRTSVDGIFAMGDIAGNYQFKHSGDKEAAYVIENAVHGNDRSVAYPGMAHAVFGSPQLASLGQAEHELDGDMEYTVGTCAYDDTALGAALHDDGGFAKAIVGADAEILGCHVVGPQAATMIHEVSTAVAAGGDARTIAETIHVHPAISEVIQGAFRDACNASLPDL